MRDGGYVKGIHTRTCDSLVVVESATPAQGDEVQLGILIQVVDFFKKKQYPVEPLLVPLAFLPQFLDGIPTGIPSIPLHKPTLLLVRRPGLFCYLGSDLPQH
jgi:hypothetical protein